MFCFTDPFEGLKSNSVDEMTGDSLTCNCVSKAFDRWRPNAWRTARWLFGLSVLLFTTAVVAGIVEDNIALWASALAVSCVLLALAVVASVFACRSMLRSDERVGREETPADDGVAAFA